MHLQQTQQKSHFLVDVPGASQPLSLSLQSHEILRLRAAQQLFMARNQQAAELWRVIC